MSAVVEGALPSELNTRRCGPGLEVNRDKLTVTYTAAPRHQSDVVGAIQSSRPVPLDCRVFFFEATVCNAGTGTNAKIGIGFSGQNFQNNKLPGWDASSYGYYGSDGKKFHNGTGQAFSEVFGKGDVVGAGYHLQRQEIFFTKNGTRLGTAYIGVRGLLYPTVGLHSPGACVQINFGSAPFNYDIEAMIQEEREQEASQINSMQVATSTAHQLVQDYLLHYGYADTLRAFEEAAGAEPSTSSRSASWEVATLPLRQQVRQRVVAGDTEGAVELLKQHYPSLLSDAGGDLEVAFHLYCQQYIDIVRNRRIEDAVTFAQQKLWPLRPHQQAQQDQDLQTVIALVAYNEPEASPLAHLLSLPQRERAADVANAAILSLDPCPANAAAAKSALELLLQQLVAAHAVMREEGANQGEVFRLHDHLSSKRGAAASSSCAKQKVL